MQNKDILKKIMEEHGLTRSETAKLLSVSHKTIDSWLAPNGTTTHRDMPDRMIEFLKLKIEA